MKLGHRNLLLLAAASAALLDPTAEASGQTTAASACRFARDVRLVNGRIVTMDPAGSVAASLNVKAGRIVGVGQRGDRTGTPCTRTIDLKGRTVVPGLIDNHIHFVALGRRPGHDTPLDTAASIAEVRSLIAESARDAPPGSFVTAIGGWTPGQFAERRLPTLAELDSAAPGHPVLLVANLAREAVVNAAAREILEPRGVDIGPDGRIGSPAGILRAVFLLKNAMTNRDLRRGTERTMDWAVSLGLTTVMDMGSHEFTGTDKDTVGAFDPATGYNSVLQLAREDRLKLRYRLNLISWDGTPELPLLKARLNNSLLDFGGDMIRTACIGETVWTFDGPGGVGRGVPAPGYAAAAALVARHGHCYEQHSLSAVSNSAIVDVWESVNAATPIAGLRWRIAHAAGIDGPTVTRMKALGAGLGLHGTNRSPYRMVVDSGIRVGAGSDGRNCCSANPWPIIQYMVTGRNASGDLDNPGQTLTRSEALRLYTAANGWFGGASDRFGSLEIGSFGDVAVLSGDLFDTRAVPDAQIGRLRSVLTIVGGRVVHDEISGTGR